MHINSLIVEAHLNAKKKGFWDNWDVFGLLGEKHIDGKALGQIEDALVSQRLMDISTELGEAQDALRKRDKDNFKEEIADTVLRICDLCGGLDINLEEEIKKKMEKNIDRPYLHNKAF